MTAHPFRGKRQSVSRKPDGSIQLILLWCYHAK
jgi:hypothetical protein